MSPPLLWGDILFLSCPSKFLMGCFAFWKFFMWFFAFLEETHRMFLKFFTGFLEVLYGNFCIFGSSSWDNPMIDFK
jgi:hypothetical protein